MASRNRVNKPHLTAYDHKLPFTHFAPLEKTPIRNVSEKIYYTISIREIDKIIESIKDSKVVALDYEANGVDIPAPTFTAVGVGLAWDKGRVYIVNENESTWLYLHKRLLEVSGLIAHNIMYDGAVFYKIVGQHPQWLACTYGMYRQLTNEGFERQRWGLKAAQEDILLWEETNEVDLNKWLIDNQYIKAGISKRVKETQEEFDIRYKAWVIQRAKEGKRISPNKSQMYRAPADILGKYCILDCEATYLLYTEHFVPVLKVFPEVQQYHDYEFLGLVELLIEQYLRGVRLDVAALKAHKDKLISKLDTMDATLRNHPDAKHHIDEWEKERVKPFLESEPKKYKKKKKIPTEPTKIKKDGTIAKTWINWEKTVYEIEHNPPVLTKLWITWNEKREAIEQGLTKYYNFNFQSPAQIQWLLFERMYDYIDEKAHVICPRTNKITQWGIISINVNGNWIPLDRTYSGGLPTGDQTLKQLGSFGKMLNEYKQGIKELGYVDSYIDLAKDQGDIHTIHPSFKAPGTLTGRLSGNSPNIQQAPKTFGTMQAFLPREGYTFLDCDHASLEQVVLAELSRDPALMKLYGPNAKANDVYLFVGAQLPGLGDPIREAGYDPDDPTVEGIANAKKTCKRERGIAKVVVLASSYGAGAKKIHKTLMLNGIELTLEQVKEIHATYWRIFAGVKDYSNDLYKEWNARDGFVENCFNRPINVAADKTKDIMNRMCQTTGHDVHMLWVQIFAAMLNSQGLEWYPIVIDWHDQAIIECRIEDAEKIKQIVGYDSYDELNRILSWEVKMKGDPMIIENMAEAKIENYQATKDAYFTEEEDS